MVERGTYPVSDRASPQAILLICACSFRPKDLPPQLFRNAMAELQQPKPPKQPAPPAELIKTFKENRKKFKPVMRHFFTDMCNDPIGWYSMRLKYARSVAVGSIVGHLVGLGDRHCSNIMINTKTGEILHIDLGIAFDQASENRDKRAVAD